MANSEPKLPQLEQSNFARYNSRDTESSCVRINATLPFHAGMDVGSAGVEVVAGDRSTVWLGVEAAIFGSAKAECIARAWQTRSTL
jgi:hypothetical protein